MPETNGNETPVSQIVRNRKERTEAKFFKNVEKIIAKVESIGEKYQAPNSTVTIINFKAKLAAYRISSKRLLQIEIQTRAL